MTARPATPSGWAECRHGVPGVWSKKETTMSTITSKDGRLDNVSTGEVQQFLDLWTRCLAMVVEGPREPDYGIVKAKM